MNTSRLQVVTLLQQGVAAARSGRATEARQLLQQVVRDDPDNETAWLWLSSLVATREQKRSCLVRVLRANPHNAYALAGLARLLAPEEAETDILEARLASVTSGFAATSSAPPAPHLNEPVDVPPRNGRQADCSSSKPPEGRRGDRSASPIPAPLLPPAGPIQLRSDRVDSTVGTSVICPACDRQIEPDATMCPYCYLPLPSVEELLARGNRSRAE
jgi:hypothetical protein